MLTVSAALLPDYLRAALRLWATELRPSWRPDWLGDKHGWAGDEPLASPDQGNRVVLAKVMLKIEPSALNSAVWTVARDADVPPPDVPIAITDDARPYVLPLRLLQEWLITHSGAGGSVVAAPRIVAAGAINANGTPGVRPTMNALQVQAPATKPLPGNVATQLLLSFTGYSPPITKGGPQYLVQALPWPTTPIPNLSVTFGGFDPGGVLLVLSKNGGVLASTDLDALQLIVEVSQYP